MKFFVRKIKKVGRYKNIYLKKMIGGGWGLSFRENNK